MLFERPEVGETAILISVTFEKASSPDLDELVELSKTAGLLVVEAMKVFKERINPKSFIGKGKLEEIKQIAKRHEVGLLVINNELSPGQQRNIETAIRCRVVTRTELILMIFADRALSHEGQLQVELAQLKHAQTRLVRGWTHLDRQKGGVGLRGAGEKQVELDRRMLSDRVKFFEKKLAQIEKNRRQNRRLRHSNETQTMALVGYTNAGKSSLFNRLSGADALVADKLFATLDPTIRRVSLPGVRECMLADTVGFVSQLPHQLVEAFHATLEEVSGADLLLHVVDVSDENFEARIEQVRGVLGQIGADGIPELLVFNKIDLLDEWDRLDRLGKLGVCISVKSEYGLDELTKRIASVIGVFSPYQFKLSVCDGSTRAWLYQKSAIIEEKFEEEGYFDLTLRGDPALIKELKKRTQS